MSQKKDENEINHDSFEYEDRISNVIITPKNKDILNSNKQTNKSQKESKPKINYNTINYNSISNRNLEEQNKSTNKINGINFSSGEMEFLNGMKSQLGFSESQNLNGMDQQKLFETFLMFQKFLSSQGANSISNSNTNVSAANQNENLNHSYYDNEKSNMNGNPNFEDYNGEEKEEQNFNRVPPDYIHQRKKIKGTLSNSSNMVNEFKRSNTNNFSLSDKAGSLEKNKANTIEQDKIKNSLNDENNYHKNDFIIDKNNNHLQDNTNEIKNSNAMIEEKSLNSKLINKNINNNENKNDNKKTGFNRLKNRNKSTSDDHEFEKEKKENFELNNDNRNKLKESLEKTNPLYNSENLKVNKNENKPIEYTPNKDIEFFNRSSFDVKKENMPNNLIENLSSKKPESNQLNNNFLNSSINKKTPDDSNSGSLINNDGDSKLNKKLESNGSIKRFNDEIFENKNIKKNLNKKLNEEDFMPKKENLLSLNNKNKISNNKSVSENTSKIENFDDIPIKSSHTNFLELFEKNLAAEEGNIPGTINNDETSSNNNESKKAAVARRNNSRFKKEIKVSIPSKETKKYKYYSDNFEEKSNDVVNDNVNNQNLGMEHHNDKDGFGNFMSEKHHFNTNNSSGVANGNNNKNKKPVNKSVEKTSSKRPDPAAKIQEDKSFNLNLNGNLSGSTHIPKTKGKFATTNSRKNTKNNQLR